MRVFPAAPAGVTLLVAAGCAGTPEPAAAVHDVSPVEAFNDAPVPFLIHGGPFRPAYEIDTSTGKTTLAVDAFEGALAPASGPGSRVTIAGLTWQQSDQLAGTIDAGIMAGLYDVELRDPRGNVVVRSQAFRSLGPDKEAPAITIVAPTPNSVVAADTAVAVTIRADDGFGHLASLTWSLDPATVGGDQACPLDVGVPHVDCEATFSAPTPAGLTQQLTLQVKAIDSAGNPASGHVDFLVALRPVATSFSPGSGPTGGMTTLTVQGDNFVGGGTQILVDGVPVLPDGGQVTGMNVISGFTPPHDPGVVPVVVRTGGAEAAVGTFEYVAPPRIRFIDPSAGPTAGFTPVVIAGDHFRSETQIFFGRTSLATRLMCLHVESAQRITGLTPPGTDKVTVFADDPVAGGVGSGPDFTYVAPRDGGAGQGPDAGAADLNCEGP